MCVEEMFTDVFPAAMEALLGVMYRPLPHKWELRSMRKDAGEDILLFFLLHHFLPFTCFQILLQLKVSLHTPFLPYLSSHSPKRLAKGPIWFLIFTSRVPNWLKGI